MTVCTLPLIAISIAISNSDSYRVVEVTRTERFAGRLGKLVQESLVLERGGDKVCVHVRGYAHDWVGRANHWRVGDHVTLHEAFSASGWISREAIKRVKT